MRILPFLALFVLSFQSPLSAKDELKIPDLTRGDAVPDTAKHDWNLGPTGARGWIFCDKLVTSDARQILITTIATGSPADGVVAVGDVILGVEGKPFAYDPRTEMGKAITNAESEVGAGKLVLTRWRNGQSDEVVLTLPVLGSYSPTSPYQCPKSTRILEQGCKQLAERMATTDYGSRTAPIVRALMRSLCWLAVIPLIIRS